MGREKTKESSLNKHSRDSQCQKKGCFLLALLNPTAPGYCQCEHPEFNFLADSLSRVSWRYYATIWRSSAHEVEIIKRGFRHLAYGALRTLLILHVGSHHA